MNTEFKCPKCGGTDTYLRNTRVIKGIGGVWGNRQVEELKHHCKKCDIEAIPAQKLAKANAGAQVNFRPRKWVYFVFYPMLGVGLAMQFISGLTFLGIGMVFAAVGIYFAFGVIPAIRANREAMRRME